MSENCKDGKQFAFQFVTISSKDLPRSTDVQDPEDVWKLDIKPSLTMKKRLPFKFDFGQESPKKGDSFSDEIDNFDQETLDLIARNDWSVPDSRSKIPTGDNQEWNFKGSFQNSSKRPSGGDGYDNGLDRRSKSQTDGKQQKNITDSFQSLATKQKLPQWISKEAYEDALVTMASEANDQELELKRLKKELFAKEEEILRLKTREQTDLDKLVDAEINERMKQIAFKGFLAFLLYLSGILCTAVYQSFTK